MTRAHADTCDRRRFSRRATIKALGAAGATTLGARLHAVTAQGTPAASPVSGFDFPDTGADLPEGQVTFDWSSFGAENAAAEKLVTAYQEAHPNITLQFQNLPAGDYNQLLGISIQSGDAPDLFRGPNNLTAAEMVASGWVAPLDDAIPAFERWKAAFPPNSFIEGINVFGGQTYSFPFLGDKRYGNLLYYDVELLQRAGFDPLETPLTWDTFREAARKVTEQGSGNTYGYVIGGQEAARWGLTVGNLAAMAGAAGQDFNWMTGEYNYTTDPYLAAIELLRAVQSDGSLFPGSLSLNNQEAQDRLPQGVAAMMNIGAPPIAVYQREFPDFTFNVVSQPLPNGSQPMPIPAEILGVFWFLYVNSDQLAIGGDLLAYLGSAEGQTAWQIASGGQNPMTFPTANDIEQLDERSQRIFDLFQEQMRFVPDPAVRNPDVAQALLEYRPPQPNLGQLVQGIMAGQIADPGQAMQDLQDRSDQALDAAIEAARQNGAEVSRDDWVFPNWDPTQDYAEEDYAALQA